MNAHIFSGLVEALAGRRNATRSATGEAGHAPVRVAVAGTGGAGGNAVARMVEGGVRGVRMLALNTDVQALSRLKRAHTFAIGPNTTGGMGSGGRPEVGRKAVKESQSQVAELLDGSDMVFVTCGMGGGGPAPAPRPPVVADIARRAGALTVGVVTMPFTFEGPERRAAAIEGIGQLSAKVDTLIAVENDRLLDAAGGEVRLDRAFALADEVLRQGVQGISDLVTAPGVDQRRLRRPEGADAQCRPFLHGPGGGSRAFRGRRRRPRGTVESAFRRSPGWRARPSPERDGGRRPDAGPGARDGRVGPPGQRIGRRRAARCRAGPRHEAPRPGSRWWRPDCSPRGPRKSGWGRAVETNGAAGQMPLEDGREGQRQTAAGALAHSVPGGH